MNSPFLAFSDKDYKERYTGGQKDTVFQILVSCLVGVPAFVAFCILRPRWPSLYAARIRQKNEAESLPELPKSALGWLPVLWRITEEQVIASAGLDAFVFLAFFKMAIKFLVLSIFFALTVIKPVHDRFPEDDDHSHRNKTHTPDSLLQSYTYGPARSIIRYLEDDGQGKNYEADYLWMYLVFAYFFTGALLYLVISESKRIIKVRQEHLGSQATITDRTIRLSGIPDELQSEEKIKDFVEELEIGKVESVLLCKDWKKLDDAVEARMAVLRKLECALVGHQHMMREERRLSGLPTSNPGAASDREDSRLLEDSEDYNSYRDPRPKKRIWYGKLNLRYKHVDAIDYYEEKLRFLDNQIHQLRDSDFPPQPLAFVTMDSVASCQMAVQAVLDSSPLELIATPSPPPMDIAWQNTYMPRYQRMFRSWSITSLIVVLTVFWSVLLLPIAGLIDLKRIHAVFPQFAELIEHYPLAKSLVVTQAPTLILSLFNVAVPYFYSWLSYQQGMMSHGDVELSVISKNFFFTFFNFFIVFTALGTASMSFENFGTEPLRETALQLAKSIQSLRQFYVNYIILQALGLFPLRLLEFGSVSLYPFGLMTSKTPRDHSDFQQPPQFSYGFYLPQTILIFLICIVYSVLRSSWQVLLPGFVYFVLGYFVYKYQLLYAMDHQQHSNGKSWVIIVERIVVGLVIFQVVVAGQLALRGAFRRSVLIVPLVIMTLWFTLVYNRSYKPLMTYIALRSIRRAEHADEDARSSRNASRTTLSPTSDDSREMGMKFINPNVISTLEAPWVSGSSPRNGRR